MEETLSGVRSFTEAEDPTLRLYAIVRTDLHMPPGKLAAQAGHAFVEALKEAQENWDTPTEPYLPLREYLAETPGTKIVLAAPSERHLLDLHDYARKFLPTALVVDSGHVMPPHFTGDEIVTALGIGPCTKAQITLFTKNLRLL